MNKKGEYIPYIPEGDLSDSNLLPVTVQKASKPRRPAIVPLLDLYQVPLYDSDESSDDDEENSDNKQKRGPNPR